MPEKKARPSGVMTTVSGLPFEKIVVAVAPFLIPLAAVLMLITYVPQISLFLRDLIMQ